MAVHGKAYGEKPPTAFPKTLEIERTDFPHSLRPDYDCSSDSNPKPERSLPQFACPSLPSGSSFNWKRLGGDGGYKAVFYLPDQSGDGYTASKVTLDGPTLKMTLPFGTYAGKLSPDGKTITGIWTQESNSLPLIFTRATPETEWTIPPPTSPVPHMDANANPSFEVATIKPSPPNRPGKTVVSEAGIL